MRTRQREPEETTATPPPSSGSPLTDVRSRADRLLAAGSQAIDRVLSGDSRAYLEANRQEGGQ